MPLLETIYPLTAGLSGKVLRKAIAASLMTIQRLPEWHDKSLMDREKWPAFLDALQVLHKPEGPQELEPASLIRRRLACDELLATQLALAIVRERTRRKRGRALKGDGSIRAKLFEALPYELTGDQKTALSEVLGTWKVNGRCCV